MKETQRHGLTHCVMSIILTTEKHQAKSADLEKYLLVLGEKMACTGLPKAICTQ